MNLKRLVCWKSVATLAICSFLIAAVPMAFPPGNNGDTTADFVLGQPDFLSSAANSPDANSLYMTGGLSRVAIDKSVTPNRVYVADSNNNRILGFHDMSALIRYARRERRKHRHTRRVGPNALSNNPNADIVIGQPNFFSAGCNTGGRSARSLCTPQGVAVDSAGNLWVADSNGNNRVLEYNQPFSQGITANFSANVVLGQAGNFTSGAPNLGGTLPSNETLNDPEGIAIDASNHLWVADRNNNRVLEFNTPLTSDAANFEIGQPDFFSNGAGLSATALSAPTDVALDSNANLYVADFNNNRVLEYNTPLASNNQTANQVWGQGGSMFSGSCDGVGITTTSLCNPEGVGLDASNNLYIADASNNRILEYNESANPPTNLTANRVFGQGGSFTVNGCNQLGLSAGSLCTPEDVAFGSSGMLAVDSGNNRVLLYTTPLTSQTANVVLGQPDFLHATGNTVDPESFNQPQGIAIDAGGHLFVADTNNHRVLGFSNVNNFVNGAPATLVIGQPDLYSGSCNQATSVSASTLCTPLGLATDASSNLYVADESNHRVLEFNNPFAQGITHGFVANAVFGQSNSFTANSCNQGGAVSALTLCNPNAVAVDKNKNVYIADMSNHRVLEYNNPLCTSSCGTGAGDTTADTEFGQGSAGSDFTDNGCDNGGVLGSSLCNPTGVATDASNNVFIADNSNSRVLEFNESANPPTNFTANHVFGQGGSSTSNSCDFNGVTADSLCFPERMWVDSSNNLYVADQSNNRVLTYKFPLCTSSCSPGAGDTTADFVFGQADNFTSNSANFGSSPSAGTLSGPASVAVSNRGDLVVADDNNNRVLKYLLPLNAPGFGTIAPSPWKFGSVFKGDTKSLAVTVSNAGAVPVLYTGASISGTNAADFTITGNNCVGYITPPANCAISVSFTPSQPIGTNETATIRVFDNGVNAPQSDAITGTSANQVGISPTSGSINFGSVPSGTTSAPVTSSIVNFQSVPITLSPLPQITSGATVFAISSMTCTSTVAGFGSCNVNVTCKPTSAGPTFTGTLTYTDSPDSLSPHNVSLSCTGS